MLEIRQTSDYRLDFQGISRRSTGKNTEISSGWRICKISNELRAGWLSFAGSPAKEADANHKMPALIA